MNLAEIGSVANGSTVVVAVTEAVPPPEGEIWSNEIPESCASWLSVMITSGVSSLSGIACVVLKTLAERTAGSACVNADERLLLIWPCTAATCCFRLAAVERFGEIRVK